jgi:hypothetical protein
MRTQVEKTTPYDKPDDLRFQERSWIVERTAWIVYTALIFLTALGLFGRGPLSQAVIGGPEHGIEVHYERFLRAETITNLHISFLASDDPARLWIDSAYFEHMQLSGIHPEPEKVTLGEGGWIYEFPAAPAGKSGSVTFYLEPEKAGHQPLKLKRAEKPELEGSQWVYP